MHFAVAVLLPEGTSKEEAQSTAEQMLAPYDENGDWFADGSRWDWWVVGGRWDGALLGLPWQPVVETCSFCKGTGVSPVATLREDGRYDHHFTGTAGTQTRDTGCHVCDGTGKDEAWPTNDGYQTLERNFAEDPSKVAPDFLPAAYLDAQGWHEEGRMGWFGIIPDEHGAEGKPETAWAAEWKQAIASHRAPVILVDCHV